MAEVQGSLSRLLPLGERPALTQPGRGGRSENPNLGSGEVLTLVVKARGLRGDELPDDLPPTNRRKTEAPFQLLLPTSLYKEHAFLLFPLGHALFPPFSPFARVVQEVFPFHAFNEDS